MPTTLSKIWKAFALANAVLVTFVVVFVLATNAHAAEIETQSVNDSNGTQTVQSGNASLTQLETTGYSSTGYVDTLTTSTATLTSMSFLLHNSGGSTCTSTMYDDAPIYYCKIGTDCTGGDIEFGGLFGTCDAVSVPAGGDQWVECTTPAIAANRIFYVAAGGFSSSTNCSSTYFRYQSTDILGNSKASSGDVNSDTSADFAFRMCTAGTDCGAPLASPPVISNVDVVEDYNTAAISWDTDDAATSEIFWGLTAAYGSNVTDLDETTAHALVAHTLQPGTLYHYQICSTNGDDEETCTTDATFTTLGGDPLADFGVTVYDPPPDRIFGPGIIDQYTFRAVFGVDSNVYPDETIVYDYKLSNDVPTVLYDSPALPILTAGHYICALPGDCTVTYYAAHFTIPYLTAPGSLPAGDYTIEVRAKTLGGTYGDYSDPVTFTVQDVGCTDADGFIPQAICRIGSLDLIYPSPASTSYFDAAVTGFSTTGAAGFFGDVADVADETDVICPLPTFVSTKFGYAGSLTMPTYDLCDEATDIAADLNAVTGFQDAVQAVVAVLGLLIAVAFFKKFVEG